MLPEIEFNPNTIWKIGNNPWTGTMSPLCEAFWFNWTVLIEHCRNKNMNLDHFLTSRFVSYFSSEKLKSPLAIYFAGKTDKLLLAGCSKRNVNFLRILHSNSGMEGYLEYGEDFLIQGAIPFYYFNGSEHFRIYTLFQEPQSEYLICDLGNGFQVMIEDTDKETYDGIKNDSVNYTEYSAIPIDSQQKIVVSGEEIIVNHVFIRSWI